MPSASSLQISQVDLSKLSPDKLDKISKSALGCVLNEALDSVPEGDSFAAFNSALSLGVSKT